jgi:hypothetical protein
MMELNPGENQRQPSQKQEPSYRWPDDIREIIESITGAPVLGKHDDRILFGLGSHWVIKISMWPDSITVPEEEQNMEDRVWREVDHKTRQLLCPVFVPPHRGPGIIMVRDPGMPTPAQIKATLKKITASPFMNVAPGVPLDPVHGPGPSPSKNGWPIPVDHLHEYHFFLHEGEAKLIWYSFPLFWRS